MKASINKVISGWMMLVTLAACTSAAPATSEQTVEQTPHPAAAQAPVVTVQKPTEKSVKAEPALPVKPKPKAYVPSPDEVIEQLKAWDEKLLFLKTSFTQVTSYDGIEISRSHGTLFYDKDRQLLRLDTLGETDEILQSAVTDKKDLVILDDAGRTVLKGSWNEWQQNQPNQALFDFGNYTALLARHQVRAVRPNYFALTPKTGETYTLYLTLSPQDAFPTSIKLESDGMSTQADLKNIQKNEPLSKTVFGGVFK